MTNDMIEETCQLFTRETQEKVSAVRAYIAELNRDIEEDMTDEEVIMCLLLLAFDMLKTYEQNILIAKTFLGYKSYTQLAADMLTYKQQLSIIVASARKRIRQYVLRNCEERHINVAAFKFKKIQTNI